MRVLPAVLLLAAIVGINADIRMPDPSWAIEVKPDPSSKPLLRSHNPFSLRDDAVCNKIFDCKDCKTIQVCRPKEDGTLEHYRDIACPDNRPYCDYESGACMSQANMRCGETPDSFVCLEKNHNFPDPDCKMFHHCDENYKPTLFRCVTEGEVYNAMKQKCEPQMDDSSCGKFECEGNVLKKMKHTNFPRYYAMCKNDAQMNDGTPLVVGVCPPYYQISKTTQVCEADCIAHGKGNIPDAGDCKKYFTCTEETLLDGQSYMQRTSKSCPINYSFDAKLFMCVPDPDGKICKK